MNAKQLYQKANISITGFEKTNYPDNFFDVVVGNVPFGDYKVYDPKYNKYNFRIHDYFIAKALDQVRPGGIVAVITTKGTLDKSNPTIRKYIAERAELVGAVNTIVNKNGVLEGHCTDGIGYMQSLKDYDIDVIGKKMTIVGAGGAGTAIEIQAALDGVAEISIFNIKDKFWANAENTVKKINEKTNCKAQLFDLADHEALKREIDSSVLLANATGCGMKPLEGMT